MRRKRNESAADIIEQEDNQNVRGLRKAGKLVVTTVSAPAKAHQDTKRAQKKRLTFASGDDVMNSKLLKDESSPVSPIQAVMQSSETMSALQSWFFENEDEKSMVRLKKNEIVDMCTERGIESDGLSKPDMIEALFRWRKHALPPVANELLQSVPDLTEMALKSPAITVENKQEELVTTMEQAFGTDELTSALVKPDQIILGKKIGSGGFKEVFKGTYKGQEVAIGVLFTEKFTENDMADLENELNLLKTLRHDNVVKFIGCAPVMDEDAKVDTHKFSQFYVLTEFCKYGDLSNFMQSRQKPGPKKVLGLIYDIAFGIMYLHNRRPEAIIHRDLKSLNILIDKDEKAKISDFGLSKVRKKVRGLMHTVVGTINWQAPEMWIDNPKYSEKVDVYACGLIFWEVLRWGKEYPFNELSDAQIYEQVGKRGKRPNTLGLKPKPLVELMQQMWDQDQEKRPDMTTVVQKIQTLMNE